VRFGVLAYTLPLHNPVLLAEQVSVLDHLSRGRVEVGVGLGHRPQELASLGIDPARRQALFLESLVLMRRAWQGERFDHPGITFRFRELYVEPPYQRPHPPLWYAGTDPEAARWAGHNGLSLAVGFRPLSQLQPTCDAWRAGQADMASSPLRLALMRSLYIAERDAQARREMVADLQRLGRLLPVSPAEASSPLQPLRSTAEAEQALDWLLANEAVIAGSPETCAEAIIHAARSLRLDVFLANPYLTGVEPRRVERTLRLLATAVRPRVRDALSFIGT
jgi:alkanesulfonate monooxygenase SsuD/methylene tetrahydromethanopterin reductase-like flavin-dependent oxidoreductase (luciferase family)